MGVSWKTVSRRTFVRYLQIFTLTIARLKCLYFLYDVSLADELIRARLNN